MSDYFFQYPINRKLLHILNGKLKQEVESSPTNIEGWIQIHVMTTIELKKEEYFNAAPRQLQTNLYMFDRNHVYKIQ